MPATHPNTKTAKKSTQPKTATASEKAPPDKGKAIWPNETEIKVIGVTGEYRSGKTLFALSIDPANTLVYDFEMSSNTYSGLWKDRVDVMAEISSSALAKPVIIFRRVVNAIESLKPGEYSVIAIDPASDFEMGLADHVADSFASYGFKSREKFESTGGIFWSHVKAFWKTKLAMIAQKCQTLVFTTHMRNVWIGGKPTSQKEPMGKNTLMELATLYLQLSRVKGSKETKEPWAKVLKSRLASTRIVDGKPEIIPLLPPTLPVATPDAIRKYIVTPPDYAKLKAAERMESEAMSDEQKRIVDEQIALSKQATAEAELETERLRDNARNLQEKRHESNQQSPRKEAKEATREKKENGILLRDKKEATGTTKEAPAHKSGEITNAQISHIATLVRKLAFEQDAWKAALKKKYGFVTIMKLDQSQVGELIKTLDEMWKKSAPKVAAESTNDYDKWANKALS